MGERAKRVFEQQSGATDRCVKALRALVSAVPVQAERDQAQPVPAFEIAPALQIQNQPIQDQSVQEQAVPAAPVPVRSVQSAPPQTRQLRQNRFNSSFFKVNRNKPLPSSLSPLNSNRRSNQPNRNPRTLSRLSPRRFNLSLFKLNLFKR